MIKAAFISALFLVHPVEGSEVSDFPLTGGGNDSPVVESVESKEPVLSQDEAKRKLEEIKEKIRATHEAREQEETPGPLLDEDQPKQLIEQPLERQEEQQQAPTRMPGKELIAPKKVIAPTNPIPSPQQVQPRPQTQPQTVVMVQQKMKQTLPVNSQTPTSKSLKVENSDPYNTLTQLLERLRAVDRNQCPTREVCFDHDVRQIDQLTKTVSGESDGRKALDEFKKELRKYYYRDLFASQYILYENLSREGQEMYKKGVVLTLPSHFPESGISSYVTDSYRYQYKSSYKADSKKKTQVQKFNQDDVLLYLIQEIDRAQQGYDDRKRSVQNDMRVIADFQRRVSTDKNLYELLDGIIKIIDENHKKEIFDSTAFLEAYLATEYNNQIFNYSSYLRKKYDEQKNVRAYPNSRNIERREVRLTTKGGKGSGQKNDESGTLGDLAIPAVLGAAVGFLMGQSGTDEQGQVAQQPQKQQPALPSRQPSRQDRYADLDDDELYPSQKQVKPQLPYQQRQYPYQAKSKQQESQPWLRPQYQQQQPAQQQPHQQMFQQFQQQMQQGMAKNQPQHLGQQQGQQQGQQKSDSGGIMGFLSSLFGF